MKHAFAKIFPAALLLAILAAPECRGQIALAIEPLQYAFLQYEPVYLKVSMRNLSGHPLAFGESSALSGQLRFDITTKDGKAFAPLLKDATPTMKGIILQPGAVQTYTYNISRFYNVTKPGYYKVRAVISHPQMKKAYQSKEKSFSVEPGMLLWQSVVGLPSTMKDGIVTSRRYSVKSYSTGKSEFFMLVIDDDKRIYTLRKIGYNLGKHLQPKCAIDDRSNLHLLLAASPKVFAYYVFDPDGVLLKNEIRVRTESTPYISVNKELGTVVLSGGRIARQDTDYEELKELPFIKEVVDENMRELQTGNILAGDTEKDASLGNKKGDK